MVEVEHIDDLRPWLGRELGISGWLHIDQALISDFARVSGDHNWIHVDVDRAEREMPGGRTIAHGMLTFSLLSRLGTDILKINNSSKSINYGSNKVRFVTPVQCGAHIRLRRSLLELDRVESGARLTFGNKVEIEGQERVAMVAETMSLVLMKTA